MNDNVLRMCQSFLEGDVEVLPVIADAIEESGDLEGARKVRKDSTCLGVVCRDELNQAVQAFRERQDREYFERRTMPVVGRRIVPDGWSASWGSCLTRDDTGLAPFRLPSANYNDVSYPVGVEVTGNVYRKYRGVSAVRIRISFYDDGKKPRKQYGWMILDH